jgi:hypothetical protein
MKIITSALPTARAARSFSPRPIMREITEAEPMPTSSATATMRIWIGKAIPTPPIASGPTPRPMKIVSTRL